MTVLLDEQWALRIWCSSSKRIFVLQHITFSSQRFEPWTEFVDFVLVLFQAILRRAVKTVCRRFSGFATARSHLAWTMWVGVPRFFWSILEDFDVLVAFFRFDMLREDSMNHGMLSC